MLISFIDQNKTWSAPLWR